MYPCVVDNKKRDCLLHMGIFLLYNIVLADLELGKTSRKIFIECGFDISIIGIKRIHLACNRWKTAYAKNGVSTITDACTNEIVAYNLSKTLHIEIVLETLKQLSINDEINIKECSTYEELENEINEYEVNGI